MASDFNAYGDKLIPTTGSHGANISLQRVDELDQACLDFITQRMSQYGCCYALDIGGGAGAQAMRMARLGAKVLLIDLSDQSTSIENFNNDLGRNAITFLQQDVRTITSWPDKIDCVYSQRMLGFLRYAETLTLMTNLAQRAEPYAKFFVSTGGMQAEYASDYPDRNKPVQERFSHFSPAMSLKHGITFPECLYSDEELAQLLREAGLTIEKSWTSPFGNPKVIGCKPS